MPGQDKPVQERRNAKLLDVIAQLLVSDDMLGQFLTTFVSHIFSVLISRLLIALILGALLPFVKGGQVL